MSKELAQGALNAVLRNNFIAFVDRSFRQLNPGATFVSGPHLEAIAWHLERVLSGEITRLIINMPPRYLKSIMASVAFPAFALGQQPANRLVCLSYSSELSEKHARDFAAVVQSPWYGQAFPKMRIKRLANSELTTTRQGYRKTTSVGGALTGLGGNIFIIDDPQKPADAHSESLRANLNNWFSNTLLSRLDNKATGAIVVVMQRVHLNDLTGFLTEHSEDWTVLNLAAIAETDENIPIGLDRFFTRKAGEVLNPAYENKVTLLKVRDQLGADNFSAQYQQAPVPPGGAMIKQRWLRYYDRLPERKFTSRVIQSWDCASKEGAQNDWSVCTTWLLDEKKYYLIDVYRERLNYPRLRSAAIALAQQFDPTAVVIEDTSAGSALAQELLHLGLTRIFPVKVDRDKYTRLFVQALKFETGSVFFPRVAPFLAQLETELLTFPQGKYDDQVDSISQALAFNDFGYDSTLSWVS